jgi:Asp-tRNA(Asn)/Glu-tRNA(Gln) amidotransferase A subunit family amidase
MSKTVKLLKTTVVELQNSLKAGQYDNVQTIQVYLDQINKHNEGLCGVIQTAPTDILVARAQALH